VASGSRCRKPERPWRETRGKDGKTTPRRIIERSGKRIALRKPGNTVVEVPTATDGRYSIRAQMNTAGRLRKRVSLSFSARATYMRRIFSCRRILAHSEGRAFAAAIISLKMSYRWLAFPEGIRSGRIASNSWRVMV